MGVDQNQDTVPDSVEGRAASAAVKMPRAGPSNSFTFSLQHKPSARILHHPHNTPDGTEVNWICCC